MGSLATRIKSHGMLGLLIFVPASIGLQLQHANPLLIFALTCIAIMPLAAIMGRATEELATELGNAGGSLLNATFGNATEFLIALMAMLSGHETMVKASFAGSIIGNILLVLGLSMLMGGLRFPSQRFNITAFTVGASMLMITTTALLLPSILMMIVHHQWEYHGNDINHISVIISVILIAVYLSSLFFSLKTHRHVYAGEVDASAELSTWSFRKAFLALVGTTLLIALESHILVGNIEHAAERMGMSEAYIALFVVAIIGNAAEHSTAILMAMKNKMDLALQIGIGSSVQIALFVLPLIILIGALTGHPITILFAPVQIVAIVVAVNIMRSVASDGETNWIEGLQLLTVYAILGICFFYLP